MADSNSWIMDEPTVVDEDLKGFPFEYFGILANLVASDGEKMFIQSNNTVERGAMFGLNIGGKIKNLNFPPPLTYSNGLMTVGPFTLNIYSNEYRVWEFPLTPTAHLTVETWSRGIPLWYAKDPSQMVTVVYPDQKIGGFDDCITLKATLKTDTLTKIYEGYGLYERSYMTKFDASKANWIWLLINSPDFYMILYDAWNLDKTVTNLQTGRIAFPTLNEFYRFDNHIATYVGSSPNFQIVPDQVQILGNFGGNNVDIKSIQKALEIVGSYPPFNPFVPFTGAITGNINVTIDQAAGFGAFIGPPPSFQLTNIFPVVAVGGALLLLVLASKH